MATRLNYTVPIARQLLLSAVRRLRTGGLAAALPTSTRERPFIIVTGAGRSGTSAVARVLHESGVSMGGSFSPSDDDNATGYYEERAVNLMNWQMLTEMGVVNIYGSNRWPWRSTALAVAERHRDRLREIAQGALDGWKDPSFSMTLEAWLPYLPARPKIVVCLRSPKDFEDSVRRIYGLVTEKATQRQWARHYRRLLDLIRDYHLEAYCVEYNSLVGQPKQTIAALADFVGCRLSPEYVDPELRRFGHRVPKEYQSLYEEVLALGGTTVRSGESIDAGPEQAEPGQRTVGTDSQAIGRYLQQVNRIDEQVQAARAVWSVQVGMPTAIITEYEQLGLAERDVVETTRAASIAYSATLLEAQETLGALEVPMGFDSYQEASEHMVNQARLVAELTLAAVKGGASNQPRLKAALRFWRRHGRAAAVERAQQGRRRELRRAIRISGYSAGS